MATEIWDSLDFRDALRILNLPDAAANDQPVTLGQQTAALANYQPLDGDLTAIAGLTTMAFGRGVLPLADAAGLRAYAELGTLATQSGTFSGVSSGTNTGDQTITLTGDVNGSGTGSFAATISSGAVGYGKIQNITATDRLLGRTSAGAGSIEEIVCTAAGRALLDDPDAATQRLTLGAVNRSGDSMLGFLSGHADPTSALHYSTKNYSDNQDAANLALAVLLAGRATPQTIAFGNAASATAGYLTSTSHATKGKYSLNAAGTIVVDEGNARIGIGTATPTRKLQIDNANTAGVNIETALVFNRVYGTVGDTQDIVWGSGSGDAGNRSARLSVLAWTGGGTAFAFNVQTAGNDGGNNEVMRIRGDGKVGINESIPEYNLDVNGTIGFTPGASVTPVDNGDIVFEATSNSLFTIKHKGSDGVVRSGTILLS